MPGQSWLDGIVVEPGIVRQFVAMPCRIFCPIADFLFQLSNVRTTVGSGYTVEGQITGQEKFGGLQIEVIPSYHKLDSAKFRIPPSSEVLDLDKTPRELGLLEGDAISMEPVPSKFHRPAKLSDFVAGLHPDADEINPEPITFEVCTGPLIDLNIFYA